VDPRLKPAPLADVTDESLFGGKAVSLGAALRAGLPVPPGVALSTALVDAIAARDAHAVDAVLTSPHLPCGPVAVRSSAVGEDSATASFAGMHVTKLNVQAAQIPSAVREVWSSARVPSAMAYRTKHGLAGEPSIGVVIQMLVRPLAAGVLFTRNPMTGAEERVIEAAWGLGEVVVSGRVVPDFYRLDAHGRTLEQIAGDKEVEVTGHDEHGAVEVPVDDARRRSLCLAPAHLLELHELASRCQGVAGAAIDIEWALSRDGAVYLLQARPITAGRIGAA
jgi:pyruvate, water dikinase